MKKKDFLHIINDVDDKYVEEAMPPDRTGGGKAKRKIGAAKWLSVAACFALVVGIAFVSMRHNVLPPESSADDDTSRKSTDTFSQNGIMTVSEPEYSGELSFPETSTTLSIEEYPPADISGEVSEEVSDTDRPKPDTSYDFTVRLYRWDADTIEELRDVVRNTDITGYFPLSSASLEVAEAHKRNAQRCLEYISENGMLLPSLTGIECSSRSLTYFGYFKSDNYMTYYSNYRDGLPETVLDAYVSISIPRCALDDDSTELDIYELLKIDGKRISELSQDELLQSGISEAYETRMNILGEERDVVCTTHMPTESKSRYRVTLKFIYGGYEVIYGFELKKEVTSFPYADMASMLSGTFYDDIEPPLPPKGITKQPTAEELGIAPEETDTFVKTFRTYGELAAWAGFFEANDVKAIYGESCSDELVINMCMKMRGLGDPECDFIRPEFSETGFYIDSVSVVYRYESNTRTVYALRAEDEGETPDYVALTQYHYPTNGAIAEIYRLMKGDEDALAEYCGRREVLDELGFDSAEVKRMKIFSGEGKAIVFTGRGDDGTINKEIFYSFIHDRCFVSFAYSCTEENEAAADAKVLKLLNESKDERQEKINNIK